MAKWCALSGTSASVCALHACTPTHKHIRPPLPADCASLTSLAGRDRCRSRPGRRGRHHGRPGCERVVIKDVRPDRAGEGDHVDCRHVGGLQVCEAHLVPAVLHNHARRGGHPGVRGAVEKSEVEDRRGGAAGARPDAEGVLQAALLVARGALRSRAGSGAHRGAQGGAQRHGRLR